MSSGSLNTDIVISGGTGLSSASDANNVVSTAFAANTDLDGVSVTSVTTSATGYTSTSDS